MHWYSDDKIPSTEGVMHIVNDDPQQRSRISNTFCYQKKQKTVGDWIWKSLYARLRSQWSFSLYGSGRTTSLQGLRGYMI